MDVGEGFQVGAAEKETKNLQVIDLCQPVDSGSLLILS
jgi:hypothetical protein